MPESQISNEKMVKNEPNWVHNDNQQELNKDKIAKFFKLVVRSWRFEWLIFVKFRTLEKKYLKNLTWKLENF